MINVVTVVVGLWQKRLKTRMKAVVEIGASVATVRLRVLVVQLLVDPLPLLLFEQPLVEFLRVDLLSVVSPGKVLEVLLALVDLRGVLKDHWSLGSLVLEVLMRSPDEVGTLQRGAHWKNSLYPTFESSLAREQIKFPFKSNSRCIDDLSRRLL